MAIYEVYSSSIRLRYKTSVCSRATVFYFLIVILTFIPPLLITYFSQGFWIKIGFYHEQPEVHFKHKMILILETTTSDVPRAWSSYPKLNQFLMDSVKSQIPSIEHIEEDFDRDGRNEKLKMTIQVPMAGEDVVSVKLIIVFDYKLHLYSSFQMECLAYIQHSSPLPGASLKVVGDLSLHQRSPLWHRGSDLRYNGLNLLGPQAQSISEIPVVDESRNDYFPYKLENIFSAYATRNISTVFKNSYAVWEAGRGYKGPFTIDLTIHYPEEIVQYRVGFWQLLKWAWVQYLTVLVIFWFIFHRVKKWIFQNQIVPTLVFSPLKQDV